MKRVRTFHVSLLIIILCFLTSCMNPFHYQMMPDQFPGSTYYCENFDIEFTVHDEKFLLLKGDDILDRHSSITGEITVDGTLYEFYADFSADCGMTFFSKEITKEGVATRENVFEIESKHHLVLATCEYKSNGDIVATVYGGALLKPDTELIFSRKSR